MQRKIKLTELAIVIVAENHNPTILNPDFLKYNGIVPEEWVVSKPPLCAHPVSQVEYHNAMKITAELNKLIFFTPRFANNESETKISDIAKKYVDTLRHVNYKAVGINPSGHFSFKNREAVKNYFLTNMLSKGAWADFWGGIRSVSMKLSYESHAVLYNIGIDQASLKSDRSREDNVLRISGNFHHSIATDHIAESYEKVIEIIDNMDSDLTRFTDFCNLLPEY